MSKPFIIFLWLTVSLFFFSSQAVMAQGYSTMGSGGRTGQSYIAMSGEKLATGVVNIATGIVELPKTVILTSQRDGTPYGLTVGLITGIMHSVGRTVFGALDVVTFLIPTPPTVRPKYIWENFDKETTYG